MTCIYDGNRHARNVVVLAHGAGAPMDTDFMSAIALGVASDDIGVLRFEFDYMAKRREDGRKRPPDRQPKLLESFMAATNECPQDACLYIGGKSMGGRMASLLVSEKANEIPHLKGWFALGYPFHPPGKPEKLRTEHLSALPVPGLIVQGSRDPFGNKEEGVETYLGENIKLCWAEDGNHDLAPRKSSGLTKEENLALAVRALREFVLAGSK
ncbi:alpha/beta family hydrolase [Hahella ganghwensis]|uniref:alpha/beta family hydrolase n=1 Tax=Hahella ganghwensis TaxID=286420 RepID=UPI00036F5B7B|nr:alpha/beta family hydrolase [Hahella ganghwensis]